MKSGLKVIVVEKDTIAAGVTGHTTGKVTSQHSLIYAKLEKRLGTETARIYGTANQTALQEVARIIKDERIDCDWAVDDNYVFTSEASQVKEFEQEAETAARLGLPATFTKKSGLPFDIAGAVKFSKQGKLHSRKYLLGLADAITRGGGKIFEKSKIVTIRSGDPCRIRTVNGTVNAKYVVVATNVPTLPLLARATYAHGEYPMQSYIVSGEPEREIKGMYISPDKGHYSILPIKLDGEPRLLIGGEGNFLGTRLNFKQRHQRLADYGMKYFGMHDITHRWFHRDYMGYDDMPLVGRLYPQSNHLFTATGFMKWGLTNATMSAMILTDLINDVPNEWAKTFDPYRASLPGSIPKFIGEKLGFK